MIYVLGIGFAATFWRYVVMFREDGRRTAYSRLIASIPAGVVAGLLFGILARVAMRMLALGMDVPLRWTVTGSFAVVMIFAGLGLTLALPYPALFRMKNRVASPLLYAGALTVITLQPFIRAAAQDLGLSAWDARVISGATLMTMVLWFPYAFALEAVFSRVLYRMHGEQRRRDHQS